MLEKPKARMVNMTDARTNLSKLVKAAENGENIIITRNGKPVVRFAKLEEQVQAKGWSKKMLAHFAKALAKPVGELEPNPFPKSQELDDFRDPFAEPEPEQ
jgi:prevent-host-death family protein